MTEHEKRIREALEVVPLPHDWKVCEEPANEYWFAGRTIGAADPADARRVADTCELDPNAEKFAQYIAACNPAALRALLADLDEARAALTAAKAGGWVAVPVEPTDEMLAAGKKQAHSNNSVGAKCLRIYAAMLAARPLPNPPKEQA